MKFQAYIGGVQLDARADREAFVLGVQAHKKKGKKKDVVVASGNSLLRMKTRKFPFQPAWR